MVQPKQVKYFIETTFAHSKAECKGKLKAISNYKEIKERLSDIRIEEAVKYDTYASLDGYCAYILETD